MEEEKVIVTDTPEETEAAEVEELPAEVMELMQKGESYAGAMAMVENSELRARLRDLEQEAVNAARSTGSRRGSGASHRQDPFDAGWEEL